MRMVEDGALRRIFGPKKHDIIRGRGNYITRGFIFVLLTYSTYLEQIKECEIQYSVILLQMC